MPMTTTMSLAEVIALSLGWVVAIIAMIFHILIWKFTNAWTFLRAWFQKVPIVRVHDGGMVEYKKGTSHDEGTIDMPKGGFLIKTHNSHEFDRKSKVPIYEKYGDFAFSLDPLYNPIITEMKQLGLAINNIDDYRQIIKLATDKKFQDQFIQGIEDEELKRAAVERIEQLEQLTVSIKPYKTYPLQDLSTMFPNNINTINNEHKVMALVNRNSKKQKLNVQLLIYAGITCLIVVFALAALMKFVKDPTCPDVVCNCVKTGLEIASNAIQQGSSNADPSSAAEAAKNILLP